MQDITKSAGSQTNNKSSDNCRVLQKRLLKDLSPDFKLRILENQGVLEKSQIG